MLFGYGVLNDAKHKETFPAVIHNITDTDYYCLLVT